METIADLHPGANGAECPGIESRFRADAGHGWRENHVVR